MENLKEIARIMIDFIFDNNLSIDKATFFAIIIGQITIYGTLMVFYQFVKSYSRNGDVVLTYLGVDIEKYFMKKNLGVFANIKTRIIIAVILILEILYKPFIVIYGEKCSNEIISIINFIWFLFVIILFIGSVFLLLGCIAGTQKIGEYFEGKTNEEMINDINKKFLKRKIKECIIHTPHELLCEDLNCLKAAIKADNNSGFQERYNKLIGIIFNTYIKKSERLKNQTSWRREERSELHLLYEILNRKYFPIDQENLESIFNLYMELIKIHIRNARKYEYEQASYNGFDQIFGNKEEKILDLSEWKEVMINIYQRLSDERKEKVIAFLAREIKRNDKMYTKHCKECVCSFILSELNSISVGKQNPENFVDIFTPILSSQDINEFYTEELGKKIIYSNNSFDTGELVKVLDKKNCTYLFVYITMYYSTYKTTVEKTYIDVNMLKTLWEGKDSLKNNIEGIIKRINGSNFEPCFKDQEYRKLIQYMEADFNEELFTRVRKDKILDAFYIWVLKVCVVNQKEYQYLGVEANLDIEFQTIIINRLSRHDELMSDENILKWLSGMRYCVFLNPNDFLEKINITFRSLLLTDINGLIVEKYIEEKSSFYNADIGKYLLTRLDQLSAETLSENNIKEVIKRGFMNSGESIEEYIDMLEEECRIYRCRINNGQKIMMKKYLENLMV